MRSGHNVLVCAPTGAGKTVVGEMAVADALDSGGRVFYTAPIKALSNQKYNDLRAVLGDDQVGLLTGDHSINGDASVVVMTTEVLRNMVYSRSAALEGLRWVVLDEVHFLADSYRGPVWEEVLIHTPAQVRFACLSATVSNSDQLGAWIEALRGPTTTVTEHQRPVELTSVMFVGDRYESDGHLVPLLVEGKPNPRGQRFDGDRAGQQQGGRRNGSQRRRFRTPRRLDVVDRLGAEDLLPSIYFIFSRAGCTEAASAVLDAGVRLTSAEEAAQVRSIVENHVAALADEDLAVLEYARFAEALERGIASHHAGMVPAFREAVEECFVAGLTKVVFATETLALGINMPARSVVIERLTKFTGDGHDMLTAAQFTQLTGRAGRRGIDDHGTAVVLWSPFMAFAPVAELAASREFPLTSVFRPTYNMAVNLLEHYAPEEARSVLSRSFAQFQVDAAFASERKRLQRRRTG
ncbi:MAG: DEAD/DEAH box helicase, partial [Microthrixaceae bacterium]